MNKPEITKGAWITIGDSSYYIDGYVIDIFSDGSLSVGYFQNQIKAVKASVVWDGEHWIFNPDEPHDGYLRGAEERTVMKGRFG